jgi:hypothetical protein
MEEHQGPPSDPPNQGAKPPAPEHEILYHTLIDKVLGPFYRPIRDWIQGLSWLKATILLVLLLATTTLGHIGWEHRADIEKSLSLSWYVWDALHRPTEWRDSKRADVLADMSQYVEAEFAIPRRGSPDGRHNAWTEAQMRVALDGLAPADDAGLLNWFEQRASTCHCWRQHPDSPADHIGATAWVLLAFSRMKHPPSEGEIKFIVSNQHSAGWWPQYPSTDQEENASTYATALSVWALHELSTRNLVPSNQKVGVESAILAGREWLISHHVQDRPGTWKDYQAGYASESIGLSGLVVHVLHTMKNPPPSSIDEYWMANLPVGLPPAGDQVGSGHPVGLGRIGGVMPDSTHNFTLPWLVIATTDAYSHGSIEERARAAQLFAELGDKRGDIRQAVQDSPWFAAEVLMSLRQLRGDKVI